MVNEEELRSGSKPKGSAYWRPEYFKKLAGRFPDVYASVDRVAEHIGKPPDVLLHDVTELLYLIIHRFEWPDGGWEERDDWWMRLGVHFLCSSSPKLLGVSTPEVSLKFQIERFQGFVKHQNEYDPSWHAWGEPDSVMKDFRKFLEAEKKQS